ncbi:hypothetical protein H1C71_020961, partial [Ictidomys tridecemlineatus]
PTARAPGQSSVQAPTWYPCSPSCQGRQRAASALPLQAWFSLGTCDNWTPRFCGHNTTFRLFITGQKRGKHFESTSSVSHFATRVTFTEGTELAAGRIDPQQ